MTKVLFVHDGPRWKNHTGEQFGTLADEELYHRYMQLGDKVEFLMRVFYSNKTDSMINLNELGLKIHEVKPFNRPTLLFNYFKSRGKIKKEIQAADIIVARLPSTIGSIAVQYAEYFKKPYLVEVVACPWDALRNHSLLGWLYSHYSRKKLKKLVLNSPFVVYVTESFLQKRYPTLNETTNISNVVIKEFPLLNPKLKDYKNFTISKTIKIGTVAVTNLKYKGQINVIKAMPYLLKKGINVHYYLAGGGKNSRLQSIVNKLNLNQNVTFLGKIPQVEVFSFLQGLDLYIHPSDTEGLPRALIEAMSQGCACIGSNAGGIPELLDESVIFQAKNYFDLEKKIYSILEGDKLLFHSNRNYEIAKNYDYQLLNKKRKTFYEKFLLTIHEK
jgi:glycosyltransferase involved in cell wall biosynthesis